MDIRGISEKSVAQLYEKLDVRSVTDLYYLKADDVARLDGYKDKKSKTSSLPWKKVNPFLLTDS